MRPGIRGSGEGAARGVTVLRLDDVETVHDPSVGAGPRRWEGGPQADPRPHLRRQVPEAFQALINAVITAPAIVQKGHLDIVAANPLDDAPHDAVYDDGPEPPAWSGSSSPRWHSDQAFPSLGEGCK
ncbi:hypothetical protein ABZW47_05100 [Streptomyces sp. NPDC004549]|uniref:hypothetical protein n=1 Tax=Streptomyces sp. NPDC004549 TaxID=3154283 RepID=UPI0033BE3999